MPETYFIASTMVNIAPDSEFMGGILEKGFLRFIIGLKLFGHCIIARFRRKAYVICR